MGDIVLTLEERRTAARGAGDALDRECMRRVAQELVIHAEVADVVADCGDEQAEDHELGDVRREPARAHEEERGLHDVGRVQRVVVRHRRVVAALRAKMMNARRISPWYTTGAYGHYHIVDSSAASPDSGFIIRSRARFRVVAFYNLTRVFYSSEHQYDRHHPFYGTSGRAQLCPPTCARKTNARSFSRSSCGSAFDEKRPSASKHLGRVASDARERERASHSRDDEIKM